MSRQAEAPAPPRRRFYHRCSCGRPIPEEVRRCSARTCPEYAPTWARDTRRRLLKNLRVVPMAVMFSVTAPGADLYPFDPRFCSHRPVTRCSGAIGCRVDPELARAFNQRARHWWSQLHRAAKVRADRATGHKGRLLVRVWEKQKRGLAHVHGVVAVGTPIERAWAKAYVEALCDMAPRYGFGFVDGWHKIGRKFWPGEQAGAYLSSYFMAGRGRRASSVVVPHAAVGPRGPGRVGYRGASREDDDRDRERTHRWIRVAVRFPRRRNRYSVVRSRSDLRCDPQIRRWGNATDYVQELQ